MCVIEGSRSCSQLNFCQNIFFLLVCFCFRRISVSALPMKWVNARSCSPCLSTESMRMLYNYVYSYVCVLNATPGKISSIYLMSNMVIHESWLRSQIPTIIPQNLICPLSRTVSAGDGCCRCQCKHNSIFISCNFYLYTYIYMRIDVYSNVGGIDGLGGWRRMEKISKMCVLYDAVSWNAFHITHHTMHIVQHRRNDGKGWGLWRDRAWGIHKSFFPHIYYSHNKDLCINNVGSTQSVLSLLYLSIFPIHTRNAVTSKEISSGSHYVIHYNAYFICILSVVIGGIGSIDDGRCRSIWRDVVASSETSATTACLSIASSYPKTNTLNAHYLSLASITKLSSMSHRSRNIFGYSTHFPANIRRSSSSSILPVYYATFSPWLGL